VRRRETHFLDNWQLTIDNSRQMAVRLLALCVDRTLPPRKIPGTHFFYRPSQSQVIEQPINFYLVNGYNKYIPIDSKVFRQ
jgi:hypothetical protein